jgi:PIN domain nuclease of toxin-antitoxin system
MRSLDASAIIALVRGEPGAERVSRHLSDGLLSTVNLAEVIGGLARRGINPDQLRATLDDLPITLVDLDAELAYRAGSLEPATRREGLSLGDRACLALAERHRVPALTADRSWAAAGARLGIAVELIR